MLSSRRTCAMICLNPVRLPLGVVHDYEAPFTRGSWPPSGQPLENGWIVAEDEEEEDEEDDDDDDDDDDDEALADDEDDVDDLDEDDEDFDDEWDEEEDEE